MKNHLLSLLIVVSCSLPSALSSNAIRYTGNLNDVGENEPIEEFNHAVKYSDDEASYDHTKRIENLESISYCLPSKLKGDYSLHLCSHSY